MTARGWVVVGVGTIVVVSAGAFAAWRSNRGPSAAVEAAYVQAVVARAGEIQRLGAQVPPSAPMRKQIGALAGRLNALPGTDVLPVLVSAYRSAAASTAPSVAPANAELMAGLADAQFARFTGPQIPAVVAFVDRQRTTDPVLRSVLDGGRTNLLLRGPRDFRDKAAEGFAFERKTDFEAAVRSYQQAISLAQRDALPAPEMLAFLGLASAYRGLNRPGESATACDRTLQILTRAKLPDEAFVAQINYHLADAYQSIGRAKAAYEALERALEIHRRRAAAEPLPVLLDLIALTTTTGSVGRFDEALRFGQEARSLSCSDGSPVSAYCGSATMNLAGVKTAQSQLDEADALYREAIRVIEAEKPAQPRSLYMTLKNYSTLLEKMGRQPQAKAMRARADALFAPAPLAGVEKVPAGPGR
jgi:tetratricopeptide (TPR) repeat protein